MRVTGLTDSAETPPRWIRLLVRYGIGKECVVRLEEAFGRYSCGMIVHDGGILLSYWRFA